MAQSTQEIGRVFSPLQIGYITEVIEPINALSNIDWAMEMIVDNPKLKIIPVERDGTVLGVLPREILEKMSSSAWGKFWQKDLDAYIIPISDSGDYTGSYSSYSNEHRVYNSQSPRFDNNRWYVIEVEAYYAGGTFEIIVW